MSAPTVHLQIVVYKGDPLDWTMYRHTAFFIIFRSGNSVQTMLAHITGAQGLYEFNTLMNCRSPAYSDRFAKMVDVGQLRTHLTPNEVRSVLEGVHIDNRDREFNCHTWIERALQALKERRLLSEGDYDGGLSGMVDGISEAEDGYE